MTLTLTPPTTGFGKAPAALDKFRMPLFQEFLHVLYLPVVMPDQPGTRIPKWLMAQGFMDPVVHAIRDARLLGRMEDDFVYLTVRRGFASPGNPLNRPGWHCDGFGTEDLNYVWSNRWGTRYAEHDFVDISGDHLVSLRQFDEQVRLDQVKSMEEGRMYRLDPQVVHAVPEIDEGGMRSFIKVSISKHRYNLIGNSKNHEFSYDWKMHPRDIARNDPAKAALDFYED